MIKQENNGTLTAGYLVGHVLGLVQHQHIIHWWRRCGGGGGGSCGGCSGGFAVLHHLHWKKTIQDCISWYNVCLYRDSSQCISTFQFARTIAFFGLLSRKNIFFYFQISFKKGLKNRGFRKKILIVIANYKFIKTKSLKKWHGPRYQLTLYLPTSSGAQHFIPTPEQSGMPHLCMYSNSHVVSHDPRK